MAGARRTRWTAEEDLLLAISSGYRTNPELWNLFERFQEAISRRAQKLGLTTPRPTKPSTSA